MARKADSGPVPRRAPLVWTAPTGLDDHAINAVSCPSVSFCVAVDDHGQVLTSTNPFAGARHWQADDGDTGRALTALSCPSASVCVAVDAQGNAVTTPDAA
jgi:hypothetical protein